MDRQLRLSIFKLRIQCDTQLQLKIYMDVKILKEMSTLKKVIMGIELESERWRSESVCAIERCHCSETKMPMLQIC